MRQEPLVECCEMQMYVLKEPRRRIGFLNPSQSVKSHHSISTAASTGASRSSAFVRECYL